MKKKFILCLYVSLIFCMQLFASVAIFSASMDGSVRNLDANLVKNVFASPEQYLPVVVENLTSSKLSDPDKIMIIHDWICDNIAYDTDVFYDASVALRQDYVSILKKKKATSFGYANLMKEMCRLANIECVCIQGYFKGPGFKGSVTPDQKPDCAWNAVFVRNKWQLIDVAMDAGFCNGIHFIKHYSNDWMWLTPEQFILSHLPEDDQFQYIKKPISKREFSMQPYVSGAFFKRGISFANQKNIPYYSNAINSYVSYDFFVEDSNLMIFAEVSSADTGQPFQNSAWINRMSDKMKVYFDVPSAGFFRASLYARRRGELKNPMILSFQDWEAFVLPNSSALLRENRITKKEYEFLVASYEYDAQSGCYYFIEDAFDFERTDAVTKIFSILGVNTANFEEIFYVFITPFDKYHGYGNGKRFPSELFHYSESMSINLISPMIGSVKKGSTQKFTVEAAGYKNLLLVFNDATWKTFEYNSKNKCYERKIEIPYDAEYVKIFGVRDDDNFEELILYDVQ